MKHSELAGAWGRLERPDAELWYYDSHTAGPEVLLLHGLAGSAMEWRETIADLSRDHHVLALNQRGHGGSTREPDDMSREAHVADVLELLAELEFTEVAVVGHSMGAHTAMLFAARHPTLVSHLVMVEGGLGGEGTAATEAVAHWLRGWPEKFHDHEEFFRFFQGHDAVAYAWSESLDPRADGLHRQWHPDTLMRALAEVQDHEYLEDWSEVVAPTMVLLADPSLIDSSQIEHMLAARPETVLDRISGVGHDLHVETPIWFHRELREFLDPQGDDGSPE